MDMTDIAGQIVSYTYQYFDNFGFLLLSGIGLIVIYGVMGVINMAHGELMMIGAYIAVSTFYAGVPAAPKKLRRGIEEWHSTRALRASWKLVST